MKTKVSLYLKIIIWCLVISIISLNVYEKSIEGNPFGAFFWSMVVFFIAMACADKCVKWALVIKKNVDWAYTIGFLFALSGLLGYFIYYKSKGGEGISL